MLNLSQGGKRHSQKQEQGEPHSQRCKKREVFHGTVHLVGVFIQWYLNVVVLSAFSWKRRYNV